MFRGMPPNGKLFPLLNTNVEEDLLTGEVYSLEFGNLSWEAQAVMNMKKFEGLKSESLNLTVNVDTLPWRFGGWEKLRETLTFQLEEDFSLENMKFSTENQRITLQPLDLISFTFEMMLSREKTALFCIKYPVEEHIGHTISYKKQAYHGE